VLPSRGVFTCWNKAPPEGAWPPGGVLGQPHARLFAGRCSPKSRAVGAPRL
jgi:hypothetical protein